MAHTFLLTPVTLVAAATKQFIWMIYRLIPLIENLSWSATAVGRDGKAPDRTWKRLEDEPLSFEELSGAEKLIEAIEKQTRAGGSTVQFSQEAVKELSIKGDLEYNSVVVVEHWYQTGDGLVWRRVTHEKMKSIESKELNKPGLAKVLETKAQAWEEKNDTSGKQLEIKLTKAELDDFKVAKDLAEGKKHIKSRAYFLFTPTDIEYRIRPHTGWFRDLSDNPPLFANTVRFPLAFFGGCQCFGLCGGARLRAPKPDERDQDAGIATYEALEDEEEDEDEDDPNKRAGSIMGIGAFWKIGGGDSDAGFITLSVGLQIFFACLAIAPVVCFGLWLSAPTTLGALTAEQRSEYVFFGYREQIAGLAAGMRGTWATLEAAAHSQLGWPTRWPEVGALPLNEWGAVLYEFFWDPGPIETFKELIKEVVTPLLSMFSFPDMDMHYFQASLAHLPTPSRTPSHTFSPHLPTPSHTLLHPLTPSHTWIRTTFRRAPRRFSRSTPCSTFSSRSVRSRALRECARSCLLATSGRPASR